MRQLVSNLMPVAGAALGAATAEALGRPYEDKLTHAAFVATHEAPRPEPAVVPYVHPQDPNADALRAQAAEIAQANQHAVEEAQKAEWAAKGRLQSGIGLIAPATGALTGGLAGLAIRRGLNKEAALSPLHKRLIQGGALAAGGGVLAAAPAAALEATGFDRPLVDPAGKADIEHFGNLARGWSTGGDLRQMGQDYMLHGSRAAAVPVGPADLGGLARTMHAMPSNLGGTGSNWDQSTGRHYEAFKEGPASAYLTRSREFEQQYGPHFSLGGRKGIDYLYEQSKAHLNDPDSAGIRRDFDAADIGQDPSKGGRHFYARPLGQDPSEGLRQAHADSFHRMLQDVKPVVQSGQAVLRSDDPIGISDALTKHTTELAVSKGLPPDPKLWSRTQQEELFRDLDAHVKAHDPQLWVDKQHLDFTLGRDAPEAGGTYSKFIEAGFGHPARPDEPAEEGILNQIQHGHEIGEQAYQGAQGLGTLGHAAEAVGGAGLLTGLGLAGMREWRRRRAEGQKTAQWSRPVAVIGGGVAGGLAGQMLGLGLNALAPDLQGPPGSVTHYIAPLAGAVIGSNVGQHLARATFDEEAAKRLMTPSALPGIAAGLPTELATR